MPRDTYSEAWRHECEIRFVLAMPSRDRRAAYLVLIEKHRGKAAADKMKSELTRAWNERLADRNVSDEKKPSVSS